MKPLAGSNPEQVGISTASQPSDRVELLAGWYGWRVHRFFHLGEVIHLGRRSHRGRSGAISGCRSSNYLAVFGHHGVSARSDLRDSPSSVRTRLLRGISTGRYWARSRPGDTRYTSFRLRSTMMTLSNWGELEFATYLSAFTASFLHEQTWLTSRGCTWFFGRIASTMSTASI